MHLNVTDAVRIHCSRTEHLLKDSLLGPNMWTGDALGLRRMIGISSANDCADGIIVSFGIFKSLDDQSTDAFASAIAIRIVIESLAVSSSGQEMAAVQTSRDVCLVNLLV